MGEGLNQLQNKMKQGEDAWLSGVQGQWQLTPARLNPHSKDITLPTAQAQLLLCSITDQALT